MKQKILLIEDERDVSRQLSQTLKNHNYSRSPLAMVQTDSANINQALSTWYCSILCFPTQAATRYYTAL